MSLVLLALPLTLAGIALYALVAVYVERKVAAFIQDRLGPMEVGPKGIFQTAADIVKLLLKEGIVPAAADRLLFLLAPVVVFAAVFAGFAVIPWGAGWVAAPLQLGLLYVLAIVAVDVVGLLMAGWASNSKYALIGGVRSVAQIISYEVPAGTALLAGVVAYGTLDLQQMCLLQSSQSGQALPVWGGLFDAGGYGGLLAWGVVRNPALLLAFGVYFIAGLAENNRAPFDIPEAESELIAGFHTEYSGFRFAVFFLAEYAGMLLVSLLAAVVFLGGWSSPLPNLLAWDATELAAGAGSVVAELQGLQLHRLTTGTSGHWSALLWGLFWLGTKAFVLVLVQMWVRWTWPRLRADQLMRLCWKYLMPLAFGAVLLALAVRLAEVYA